MKHFFVANAPSEIGPNGSIARLTKLGEEIDLTPEDAAHHIRGGCALLTEEEWASVEITDEERKKYALPGHRVNIPEEFAEKLKKAWTIAGEKVHLLRHPKAEEPKLEDPKAEECLKSEENRKQKKSSKDSE